MNETRFNIEDLLLGAAFPHPVTRLQLKQTHISWVLLTGPFAYKIKKPVRYDFIDASTLERRKFLCEEELRLNRRFAPDLYVEVVAIVAGKGRLSVGGRGNPLEFAVKMRQFDPSQELAELLARDGVTAQDMRSLADTVADSHIRAAVAPANGPYGTFPKVQAPILGNFELLRRHLGGEAERTLLEQLAVWTCDSLARLKPLIQTRLQSGDVRECHGDLHARNIVRWQQLWLPFDCLEFDPELRWIDVMADTAFLFMDLVSRRREDLACEFLSRYLEETGDYAGLRLLPLYASYRALVRAKVDALGAESASPAERAALETRLTERLATAVAVQGGGASCALDHARRDGIRKILAQRATGFRHPCPAHSFRSRTQAPARHRAACQADLWSWRRRLQRCINAENLRTAARTRRFGSGRKLQCRH